MPLSLFDFFHLFIYFFSYLLQFYYPVSHNIFFLTVSYDTFDRFHFNYRFLLIFCLIFELVTNEYFSVFCFHFPILRLFFVLHEKKIQKYFFIYSENNYSTIIYEKIKTWGVNFNRKKFFASSRLIVEDSDCGCSYDWKNFWLLGVQGDRP